MVKYFSVEWLAQSHHSSTLAENHGDVPDTGSTCRPHVPCMVQPRRPSYGKGYLQAKPRASKPVEHEEPVESSLCPESCTSPISETSGDSSGSDSEAASSECPRVCWAKKYCPRRRVRTKFTPEQIGKLEKIFDKQKYLENREREKTAQKLGLTETQVRTWFQNRRMKFKRDVQDPQVPLVMFQPQPPVQYHGPPLYPPTGRSFYPLPVPQLVLGQQLPPHRPSQLLIHNPHFY